MMNVIDKVPVQVDIAAEIEQMTATLMSRKDSNTSRHEGAILCDSGHGFGFQVQTGLSFSLSDSWRLTPGVKYQTLSRDVLIGGSGYHIDLNYLSVGATLSKSM